MQFELWLLDCGPNKISVIKEIRQMTGFGLRESKDMAEAGGLVVRRGDESQIEEEAALLSRVGASVEVRPTFTRRWYVFDPNLTADQELLRVALGGTLVEERRMRFGENGAAQHVRAASDEAAQQMAILEVARQRARGHSVAETELEAFQALAKRSVELEHAIEAAPDDLGTHQVYADWLLDRGDPRGELISLSLAGADVTEYLAKHRSALLGPLARNPNRMDFSWKRGAIDSVRIEYWPAIPDSGPARAEPSLPASLAPLAARSACPGLIEMLVHIPAAFRLRRLDVPLMMQRSLAAADLPHSLSSLTLRGDWMTPLDPEAITSIARRLDHLSLEDVSQGTLRLDSDRLVTLSISANDYGPLIEGLLRSHLPLLAKLTVQCWADELDEDLRAYERDVDADRAQLERRFPRAEIQLLRRSA